MTIIFTILFQLFLYRATEFYIPLSCFTATGEIYVGTAIPVDNHTLLTAAHMKCSENLYWNKKGRWIALEIKKEDTITDLLLLSPVLEKVPKPYASFRDAQLGESVVSMGQALSELVSGTLLTGRVIGLGDRYVFHDTLALSGMSGSALVGEDGRVVGMNDRIFGNGTENGPFVLVMGAVPAKTILHFIEEGRKFNERDKDKVSGVP